MKINIEYEYGSGRVAKVERTFVTFIDGKDIVATLLVHDVNRIAGVIKWAKDNNIEMSSSAREAK